MSEHFQFIQRVRDLLEDCGLPEKIPDRSLLQELYWMIEEHLEVFE